MLCKLNGGAGLGTCFNFADSPFVEPHNLIEMKLLATLAWVSDSVSYLHNIRSDRLGGSCGSAIAYHDDCMTSIREVLLHEVLNKFLGGWI